MQPVVQEQPPTIELSSLLEKHPCGEALFRLFGAQVILRLGVDPVPAAEGFQSRDVTVDRLLPPLPGNAAITEVQISWANSPGFSADYLEQVSVTLGEEVITEQAAIGVMALLIHELEGITLGFVVQKGGGGDYFIGSPRQVEVSGIRDESRHGDCQARLRQKLRQVLKKSPNGYASVTTFRRKGSSTAHSFLHYAERSSGEDGGAKPKPRKRK